MNLASILGFLKTAWPIVSMIVSLLAGIHAGSAKPIADAGQLSMSQVATHVYGAGALSGVAFLAGTAGVVANHKTAASAPSKPAPGVNPIAHELAVLHTILVENGGTQKEFDGLKEMVVGRVVQARYSDGSTAMREAAKS